MHYLVRLFRHRERLLREVFHRLHDDPEAMETLKQAQATFVTSALNKMIPLMPAGFSVMRQGWAGLTTVDLWGEHQC